MFLAAVLNAYLQPADMADATPAIDLSANDDANAPQDLALAKVSVNPVRAEHAGTHSDARHARTRW